MAVSIIKDTIRTQGLTCITSFRTLYYLEIFFSILKLDLKSTTEKCSDRARNSLGPNG